MRRCIVLRIKKISMIFAIALPVCLTALMFGFADLGAFSKPYALGDEEKKDDILLHGDTTVSDEELTEKYGDKIPDDVMLKAFSEKLPPSATVQIRSNFLTCLCSKSSISIENSSKPKPEWSSI